MIELRNLSKSFVTAEGPVEALKNVNLTIGDGDIYGIIGMSGAGKSTLVRCINMLERPTEGSVLLDGRDLGALGKKEMQDVRRQVTMIFQSFNLLMQSTCLQNIMFPLKLAKVPRQQAEARRTDSSPQRSAVSRRAGRVRSQDDRCHAPAYRGGCD